MNPNCFTFWGAAWAILGALTIARQIEYAVKGRKAIEAETAKDINDLLDKLDNLKRN